MKSKRIKQCLIGLLALCFAVNVSALTYALKEDSDLVGNPKEVDIKAGETLGEVGRRYGIGITEIIRANPTIKPYTKLHHGVTVHIPSEFILPDVPRKGIVINLAELRLYYYPKDKEVVITEPIGIGREGHWQTPVGKTTIIKKEEDPIWRPTQNVRADALLHGTPIPNRFPPGPDNPLGKYILRLGWPTYLIHGTNRPEGVGERVSAGCIRMLPESAKMLYDSVPLGTQVQVINEPYKLGFKDKELYVEVHQPLKDSKAFRQKEYSELVMLVSQKLLGTPHTLPEWTVLKEQLASMPGVPRVISQTVADNKQA